MPENKKIKNITKEIIEKYDLKFDSSTSKTFKCSNMFKYVKYHKYILSQVPVHQFGFATVPVDAVFHQSWVSLVSGPKFCMRENLFTSGL